jgi:hypothetical protein
MRKLFFAITLFFVSVIFVSAQNFIPCATDQNYQQATIKNPELLKLEKIANEQARLQTPLLNFNKKSAIKIIPVVFHVIHQNGVENISQAQIMDEIRIMNEDYRKKVGTNGGTNTDAIAADMEIEFRLAQYDPNGNKHDGINRIYSTLTENADDNTKALSYWNSSRYFNIWVVKSIKNNTGQTGVTVLGYAQFPYQQPSQPTTDGIIVCYNQLGIIGSGMATQSGRTLTHEAGHWLGLYHPFQPDGGQSTGCGTSTITSSNCNATGDQVCDTPPVSTSTSGCPTTQNSCHNDSPDLNDLVKDYMDYADGNCMNIFTTGQKNRVYAISFAGSNYRGTISSTSNLNTTGIDATGNYTTVTASTKKAPYSYGFENAASLTSDGWIINNFNTPANGWQSNTAVSQNGASSIYMRNFTNNVVMVNSRDGFQSPEIDLTTVANPYVNFYYAYSQKNTANTDIFNLTITNNFGMYDTSIFYRVGGSGLETTPNSPVATEFFPTASEWKQLSINLSAYKNFTHARFRFELINRRGNNIYVDNFSVTNGSVLGINELVKSEIKFNVQPNPMNEDATISFELKQNQRVKIILFDMMGREVTIAEDAQLTAGSHQININKNNLKSGVYFIRFESGENTFNHKLLIN